MAKANISTFIIDLKLDLNGQVKILEFGPGWGFSNYSGFFEATGRNAIRANVMPYYRSLEKPLLKYGVHHMFKFPSQCGHDLFNRGIDNVRVKQVPVTEGDGSSLDNYSALYAKRSPNLPHPADIDVYKRWPKALELDRCKPILATYLDKAILHDLICEHVPNLFPATTVEFIGSERSFSNLFNNAATGRGLILKEPVGANSSEVYFIKDGSHTSLKSIFKNSNGLDIYTQSPIMIVQENVQGLPVAHNDRDYDPTIRMIVSAEHNEGQTRLINHDVFYYKLPNRPIQNKETGLEREEFISSKGTSLPVPAHHKANIWSQIEAQLTPAIHKLFTHDSAEIAQELIETGNHASYVTAFKLLAHPHFCEAESDEDIRGCEDSLIKAMTTMNEGTDIFRDVLAAYHSVMELDRFEYLHEIADEVEDNEPKYMKQTL